MKYTVEEYIKGCKCLEYGEKIPRKLKKAILGKMVTKTKLRRMLSDARINYNKYPESAEILPHPFCPNCGCDGSYVVDHYVEWPEVWYDDHCLKCHMIVGGADNSPYYHILEDIVEIHDKLIP